MRQILFLIGLISFFTIVSRILGYFRDILIAIFLGTGLLADAFFVAFRIPNTFRRLFAEGTFNAAFVPSYTNELTKGKSKSKILGTDTSIERSFLVYYSDVTIEEAKRIFQLTTGNEITLLEAHYIATGNIIFSS